MRAILLLALAGCSAPADCWAGYEDITWRTDELVNGCELQAFRPEELGCEKQISEVAEFGECSKAFLYRCANELTLEVFKGRDPDLVAYEYSRPDGCVTRRWLVPAKP